MTPLMTNRDFQQMGFPDLVYVREVRAADVMDDVDSGIADLKPDTVLYAVCGADGERLALLTDRASAFATAEAHELAPVSVH